MNTATSTTDLVVAALELAASRRQALDLRDLAGHTGRTIGDVALTCAALIGDAAVGFSHEHDGNTYLRTIKRPAFLDGFGHQALEAAAWRERAALLALRVHDEAAAIGWVLTVAVPNTEARRAWPSDAGELAAYGLEGLVEASEHLIADIEGDDLDLACDAEDLEEDAPSVPIEVRRDRANRAQKGKTWAVEQPAALEPRQALESAASFFAAILQRIDQGDPVGRSDRDIVVKQLGETNAALEALDAQVTS